MVAEARRSFCNELTLRQLGAREPTHDVYRLMQIAYPACFVAMAVEATIRGPAPWDWFALGAAVFLLAKVLKYWAIASLGERWCFRVLVPPGAPLVTTGPYRWLRHPNYVAVLGELAGTTVMLAAFFTGALSLLGFGTLVGQRIQVEEEALRAAIPSRSLKPSAPRR